MSRKLLSDSTPLEFINNQQSISRTFRSLCGVRRQCLYVDIHIYRHVLYVVLEISMCMILRKWSPFANTGISLQKASHDMVID